MDKPNFVHDPISLGEQAWLDINHQQQRPANWSVGIATLDKVLTMCHEGRVIGVQASTSHAKSTFLLNTASEMAKQLQENEVVVFATWEDSIEVFGMRCMARYTGIPLDAMFKKGLSQDDMKRLKHAATNVQSNNFWVVGHSERTGSMARLTMTHISQAIEYIESLGVTVKIVFLDYLQRISLEDIDPRYRGNAERTAECMNKVKDLAVNTRALVFIGTQVGRDVEERKDMMPKKGDAMWTSNFEQSCDALISQYMPEKYKQIGTGSGVFWTDNREIPVFSGLLLMEIQKQKFGKTPFLCPCVIDFKTGKIKPYTGVENASNTN